MESVAIVVIVVVGVASLGLAIVGTYRNVNNPQSQVIHTLLEEVERLNAENKTLRDYIIFLARTTPIPIPIPVPINLSNNTSIIGQEAQVGQVAAGSENKQDAQSK